MIKIGFGSVGIFDKQKSRTILEIGGTIEFKGKASIGHGSKICIMSNGSNGGGYLLIGHNFSISAESQIVCAKKIIFGDNCLLSWNILIMDTDFHKIIDRNNNQLNPNKEIIIGDKVWIGCRSTILKGSQIPNGNIIASGSVVTKSIHQQSSIIGGNPIAILKENINWIK